MKCGWQAILCPLKGQRQYKALIGLSQTTRLTGGFDCETSFSYAGGFLLFNLIYKREYRGAKKIVDFCINL